MSNFKQCKYCGKGVKQGQGVTIWASYYLYTVTFCGVKCKSNYEKREGTIPQKGQKGCLIVAGIALVILIILIVLSGSKNKEEKSNKEEKVKTENTIMNDVQKSNSDKAKKQSKKSETVDFNTFIQFFISNSDYQLAHIKFPLKYKGSLDSEGFLEKGDWNFFGENLIFQGERTIDYNECKGRFFTQNEKYIYELKRITDSTIILKMFFSQDEGEWLLIEIEEMM